jgi:hypothetical protein
VRSSDAAGLSASRIIRRFTNVRHGDPLLLAAGQLVGHPVPLALQPDEVDDLGNHLADESPWLADNLQGKGDVLVDVLPREQPEVLEDTANPAPQVRDLPVGEPGQILARYVDPPSVGRF